MNDQNSEADRQRIDLDQGVHGPDGLVGRVADVAIHPIRRTLTHVVIGPRHHHERAHLVPIEDLAMHDDGSLHTDLTVEDLDELPVVEDRDYFRLAEVPEFAGPWDVGITQVLAAPYYSLGAMGGGPYGEEPGGPRAEDSAALLAFDRVPAREVEIRRRSLVVDRHREPVGHVEAFVIDHDDQVTHIVVDGGHLWSHRETTVPIGMAGRVENDRVELTCSRDDLAALPSVPFHRHV